MLSTPVETLPGPACPANNENVPYSADCIRFMSGWFWQANATEPHTAGSRAEITSSGETRPPVDADCGHRSVP